MRRHRPYECEMCEGSGLAFEEPEGELPRQVHGYCPDCDGSGTTDDWWKCSGCGLENPPRFQECRECGGERVLPAESHPPVAGTAARNQAVILPPGDQS